ncbi:11263_t:CDS:2, partial [Dentiscutata heterogama]
MSEPNLNNIPVLVTSNDLRNVPSHVINYVDDFMVNYSLIGVSDNKHIILGWQRHCYVDVFNDANTYGIVDVNFISSKRQERLLIKFYNISYLMVPHFCNIPINARKLFQLRLDDTSEKYLYPNVIISDFIVGVWDNKVWIQSLVKDAKEWIDYLRKELNDYNRISVHFCAKEIELTIKSTLARAKSCLDDNLTKVIKKKSYYNGYLFTWIVEETDENTFLTAWKFDHEALVWNKVGNKIQTFLSELKLLTSEDIMAISQKGIYIWTADIGNEIKLLFYWGSIRLVKPKTHYELIYDQLNFLNKRLVFSKNSLPPPSFSQLISHPSFDCYMDTNTRTWFLFEDLLDYYMNDMFCLSLYGIIMIRTLIRKKQFDKVIKAFDQSLEQALLSIKDGNIYTFTEIIDNISALLIDLELFDENFGFSDRYLSKTALLLPDSFKKMFLSKNSLSSHLMYCGTYVNLSKVSFIDYISVWIYFNWKFLISKFPQIDIIFNFFYSAYFISYPRKTVKLLIPTANFATYSNDYSIWKELMYPPTNFFTCLDSPDQFTWWNIKALINFKWETYGKRYYYMIWVTYSIFMLCFIFIATIPGDSISWTHYQIFRIISITLGFFFLTFEI